MALYQVICLKKNQARTMFTLEADDEVQVQRELERKHLQLIQSTLLPGGRKRQALNKVPLKTGQLASFCTRLAPLLEMNIPTRQALGFLAENSPDPRIREVSSEMKDKMEGMSLSDALKSTQRFPPMLEGIVQVGSDSSELSESLMTMGRFYQMVISMQSGIRNALIQPIIAFVILVGFLFFSIFFTIPQISHLLDGLGTKPGWIISSVFSLSALLIKAWPMVLALMAALFYLLFADNPLRRAFTELLILKWGSFRAVFHNMRQTAILYALAILVKAQIPQGHVFRYLIDVSRGTPMEKEIQKAMEYHSKDGRFAKALEKHVRLDPEIIFTLRVGEETSTLHIQAEKMAVIYEKLSLQASEALGVKVAPVMIILTAVMAALLFGLTFGSVISVCVKLIRNGT